MKRISYKITTFAITQSLLYSIRASLTAGASSNFPHLSVPGGSNSMGRKHRSASHNPFFSLAILLLFHLIIEQTLRKISPFLPLILELEPSQEDLSLKGKGMFSLHAALTRGQNVVPYLTPEEVRRLAKGTGRNSRLVAYPERLAEILKAFAYGNNLGLRNRIFSITLFRAWQIIHQAAQKAGLNKRVYPHLLRHSYVVERLRQTGNPRALQTHLGYSSTVMTMRYLSTLTQEDALRIKQEVELNGI